MISKPKTIYLIRHAQSAYNIAEHDLKEKLKEKLILENRHFQDTPQYLKLKFEEDHEDCGITELGVKQSKQCANRIKDIDIDLIIVSPLKRALMTCDIVFSDHKCRNNVPIIVDPFFRQIFQSKCDIGSKLRQSMKVYSGFDYSLIKNIDYWYIQQINNKKVRDQILQKLKTSLKEDEDAKYLMLEYLKDLWERRKVDSSIKSEALSPVDIQREKLKLLFEKYHSIAVVTHSENIKSHTGIKPDNCTILKYTEDHLLLKKNYQQEYL